MKNERAFWSFSLDTTCPVCDADFNIEADENYTHTGDSDDPLQVCENGTKRSRDMEVVCPECQAEFLVDCII